ncbi:hypothetical protein VP01_5734g1 [Puccinia sorghi]|uniref:Tet-like 2OG-Fe(II) oxygenase domain-containing protein n=1 Tax=Puccinia sorghi TaxID=27349 RepID=A0A0L6UJB4_9BASI|nr:hypothetical protein VP01_5734g1 [Puccinia sorghi]
MPHTAKPLSPLPMFLTSSFNTIPSLKTHQYQHSTPFPKSFRSFTPWLNYFQPTNDRGKSAGIYFCKEITPAETTLDDENWAKLKSHNIFLAGRMESISQMAYLHNQNLMQEYDDGIEYSFSSNVSVTYNGFQKKSHQHKKDINGWTYGIFSCINKQTGKPIPSPSSDLEHGFLLPQHSYLIDFAKLNGIIEIFWQTTEFEHQTTQGPSSLQNRDENTWTH